VQDDLFRVAEADAATIVQPLLDAIDTHADKVAGVLRDIIIREVGNHSTGRFWFLWKLCLIGSAPRDGSPTSTLNMCGDANSSTGCSSWLVGGVSDARRLRYAALDGRRTERQREVV